VHAERPIARAARGASSVLGTQYRNDGVTSDAGASIDDASRGGAWAVLPKHALSARRTENMTPKANPFAWRCLLGVLTILTVLLAFAAILAQARKVVGPSGEGAAVSSGYVVSEVEYSVLASDAGRIAGVTFRLEAAEGAGAPSRVLVSVDAGGHWATCESAGVARWRCPLQTSVRNLTSLRVVAAQ
jgi:hypothetical protein